MCYQRSIHLTNKTRETVPWIFLLSPLCTVMMALLLLLFSFKINVSFYQKSHVESLRQLSESGHQLGDSCHPNVTTYSDPWTGILPIYLGLFTLDLSQECRSDLHPKLKLNQFDSLHLHDQRKSSSSQSIQNKTLNKVKHLVIIKMLNKLGCEVNFLNLRKGI